MRTFLGISLTGLTVAIILTSGFVTVQGQIRVVTPVKQAAQPAADKVMRVRSVVQARPQQEIIAVESKPIPLTPVEKSTLSGFNLAQLSVSPSFTLTPARPVLTNKGALLFHNASMVNTEGNPSTAVYKSQTDYPGSLSGLFNDRAITVILTALTPGKHYLIDCTVKSGDTYYVIAQPGDARQSISGTNHVLVVVEAGTDYAEVTFAGKATNMFWFFYSAEVTRLD